MTVPILSQVRAYYGYETSVYRVIHVQEAGIASVTVLQPVVQNATHVY